MTKLTKPVHRITNKRYGKLRVVVTLAPAGSQDEALIGLRLLGRRTQYVVAVSDVYRMAAYNYGVKEAKAKREARKLGIPWRSAKKAFVKENALKD